MSVAPRWDAAVIGAGANGLAAAATLAGAGRRVLVLERAPAVGGQSRALEFAPGFRAPLDLDGGWVPPPLARALRLPAAALETVHPDLVVTAPADHAAGEWLSISRDVGQAAQAIRRFSPEDAERWPGFAARMAKLAGFLAALYTQPAPRIDASGAGELLALARLGRRLRGLGRQDTIELLRTIPMSVQELLDDSFSSEPLKAAVGAGGIRDLCQGPRSGGTAFLLLHHLVGAPEGAMRRGWQRAGPGAVTSALAAAARRHGTEIRSGADVRRIEVKDDRVTGVVLASGEEVAVPLVLSSADPARTLLGLVDPVWLDPDFLRAVGSIKFRGVSARVLLALDGLPPFRGLTDPERALAGTVVLAGSLTEMERAYDAAKYGWVSDRPYVEVTVPSLRWPGLAPAGRHVLVAHVQYAPWRLRNGGWDEAGREALGERVVRVLEDHAPGIGAMARHGLVLTPKDLEERFGVTEGSLTHGELTLDQILFMRPVAGYGRYAMPVDGLFLCGAGTHPGSGVIGGPGWLAARQALR